MPIRYPREATLSKQLKMCIREEKTLIGVGSRMSGEKSDVENMDNSFWGLLLKRRGKYWKLENSHEKLRSKREKLMTGRRRKNCWTVFVSRSWLAARSSSTAARGRLSSWTQCRAASLCGGGNQWKCSSACLYFLGETETKVITWEWRQKGAACVKSQKAWCTYTGTRMNGLGIKCYCLAVRS